MALISSWEQRGIDQGIDRGKRDLIALLLQDRFGTVSDEATMRLNRLTSEQADELGRALLHFNSLADLDRWFTQH